MTTLLPQSQTSEIVYPSSDGEPLAETSVHVDAIINTVVALRQYLTGRDAIVLADQLLYYAQGLPRVRVAPDVMVVFDVPPGARDNYKIWEEGQIPVVIFEMTSAGTRNQDQEFKKELYQQLEVQEYWLFDPKGEWLPEQLVGYRLDEGQYYSIRDKRSEPLQLRLEVEGQLIAFYREDTGEKLATPSELVQALQAEIAAREQAEAQVEQERQRAEQERQRAEQERQRAEVAEQQVEQLRERLRAAGIDPDAR